MKKNALLISFTAICCIVLAGCSKNKNDSPKDYSSSFKNSFWTGELKYNFRTKNEPFSVVLGADGRIQWYEFSGVYSGSYQVNNDKKEVIFNFNSGNSVTASIKNDSTLSNFRNNGTYSWEIHSAGLHNYAKSFNIQTLIDKTWLAKVPEVSLQFRMVALANQTLGYLEDGSGPSYPPYTTGPATLSFGLNSINYFGIIMNDSKIIGVRIKAGTNDVMTWEATRL